MRILDNESDEKLDIVSVFLTRDEALQLKSYIEQLLEKPNLQHSHLSSNDYQKELTICLYDDKHLSNFDERSRRLILNDE